MADATIEAIVHAQNIAQRIGSANMAVEVYGWAIKHAMSLTKAQLDELLDILAREPA